MAHITIKNENLFLFFIDEVDDWYLSYLDIQTGDVISVENSAITWFAEYEEWFDLEFDVAFARLQDAIQDEHANDQDEIIRVFHIKWYSARYLDLPELGRHPILNFKEVEDDELIQNFLTSLKDDYPQLWQRLPEKYRTIRKFKPFEAMLQTFPEIYNRWLAYKYDHQQTLVREWLNAYGHQVEFV